MKTRGIVLQELDLAKVGTPSTARHSTAVVNVRPMVDSRSITEGKDVAGMAE
jgi:hypothetical protein